MSTDVRSVAIFDDAGLLVAAGPGSLADGAAALVARLWEAASRRAEALGSAPLEHIVIPYGDATVAMLEDHGHRITAATGPSPAVGLLLFDLRTCLGDAFGEDPR